jgi:multicomponent Na+:H+ antiporter subunit B
MDRRKERGMTLIVKTVTRLTLGFILLYGIHITLYGHAAPGGGFAGGVIIALSFVHLMLAFGKEVALSKLHSRTLRIAVCVGALVFLYVMTTGFGVGYSPISLFRGKVMPFGIFSSKVVLPICEAAIAGAGLFAIFVALVLLAKSDKDSE